MSTVYCYHTTKFNNGIIMVNSEDNHNILLWIITFWMIIVIIAIFWESSGVGAGEDIPGTSTTSLR